jgi:hypothetical protein
MADVRDITTVDEAAWVETVIRELALPRLASRDRLGRPEILEAGGSALGGRAFLSAGGGDCALWLRAG